MGVVSLPSERSTRFGNPAWPGGRTAYFAAFGSWLDVLPKNAESLRNSDALMRVAVPQASRPRWAALPAASIYSACFSGIERLDQAFRQSYYHTQRPRGQPFDACAEAALAGKMGAITLDFKESYHGRTLPHKRTDPRFFRRSGLRQRWKNICGAYAIFSAIWTVGPSQKVSFWIGKILCGGAGTRPPPSTLLWQP